MSVHLRDFALAVYSHDGVAPACLLLQGRFTLDVNLLLFAAYVAVVRGHALTPGALEEAQVRVNAWHREVVLPLRAVRDRLKSGPAPAPIAATLSLRERVKELEIQAELIELDELEGLALSSAQASGSAADRAHAALQLVVQAAGNRQPTDDEQDALTTIAGAAARELERIT